jgi:CRP-like cAMP-binding protein
MALDEEQSSAAHEMRRTIDCLRDCADLAEVDPATLEALAAGAVHFPLPAGSLLFESGSPPDGVYLVANGRLGVRTLGIARLTAEIERSELVGEAGWLLKEQRSATVFALRDSELLLLPNSALDAAAAQSTDFSLALARLCARRLRRSNRQEGGMSGDASRACRCVAEAAARECRSAQLARVRSRDSGRLRLRASHARRPAGHTASAGRGWPNVEQLLGCGIGKTPGRLS